MTHSPLPWRQHVLMVVDRNGRQVAHCGGAGKLSAEAEANAALIARAVNAEVDSTLTQLAAQRLAAIVAEIPADLLRRHDGDAAAAIRALCARAAKATEAAKDYCAAYQMGRPVRTGPLYRRFREIADDVRRDAAPVPQPSQKIDPSNPERFVVGDTYPPTEPGTHPQYGIHHEGPEPWGQQITVAGDPVLRDRIIRLLNDDLRAHTGDPDA